MTKISAEDVVALMDADWHWKPEHKALVRALEAVRVAAELVTPSQWDVAPYQTVNKIDLTLLAEALAAVERIEKGEV